MPYHLDCIKHTTSMSRHLFGSWKNSIWWLGGVVLFGFALVDSKSAKSIYNITLRQANVGITYTDPSSHQKHREDGVDGMYGLTSRLEDEQGTVVHVHTQDQKRHGCTPIANVPKRGTKWIALIQRGDCKFKQKIYNAAVKANASAVVIYNHKDQTAFVGMDHDNVNDIVSVFIHKQDGEKIAHLVDSGIEVTMDISLGHPVKADPKERKRSKVLLVVSLVLIACLVLCLSLLLLYAVRRQRYIRNKRRLRNPPPQPVLTMEDAMRSTQINLLSSEESSHTP